MATSAKAPPFAPEVFATAGPACLHRDWDEDWFPPRSPTHMLLALMTNLSLAINNSFEAGDWRDKTSHAG